MVRNSSTGTFKVMYDASKKKDNVVVVVDRVKFLWGTYRHPAERYGSELMFETLDGAICEAMRITTGFKNTGLCVDRTNSMGAVGRVWNRKYGFEFLYCALHILASAIGEARQPYVELLDDVNALQTALSRTKLGDNYRVLKKQDLRRNTTNNNNNNTNDNIIDDTAEIETKENLDNLFAEPGIPKPSTTRTWTSEFIILRWLSKQRYIIQDLLQCEEAAPYLTDEMGNIIGNPEFWRNLEYYRMKFRVIHDAQKKWQGSVCVCLFVFLQSIFVKLSLFFVKIGFW